jgi:hypothetical protein
VTSPRRVYEYGALAWVWRALIVLFVALASLFLVAIGGSAPLASLIGAAALIAPALFFGWVVVVSMEADEAGTLDIRTLLFIRRRIRAADLGAPRARVRYRTETYDLAAPRVWVPVKGSVPLYFDLNARIPDRPRFLAAIRLRASELARAD